MFYHNVHIRIFVYFIETSPFLYILIFIHFFKKSKPIRVLKKSPNLFCPKISLFVAYKKGPLGGGGGKGERFLPCSRRGSPSKKGEESAIAALSMLMLKVVGIAFEGRARPSSHGRQGIAGRACVEKHGPFPAR